MAWAVARNDHGKLQVKHRSNGWIGKHLRSSWDELATHRYASGSAQVPSAKTKRGQFRCCGTSDFVQNNLLSFVLSIFLIRCKELIQTPNLLRAPPESLEKVGAPSDVPATFWEAFPSVLHLQKWTRDRDRENIVYESTRMIKSWDVKSGHNQVQPAGQQVQLWCQPVGVTVLRKSLRRLVETIFRESTKYLVYKIIWKAAICKMELWFDWETNALSKAEVALHSGALGLPDKLKWDRETFSLCRLYKISMGNFLCKSKYL